MVDKYEMCIVHPAKGIITFLSPGSLRQVVKIPDYFREKGVEGTDYYDVFGQILDDGWEPISVYEWAYILRRIYVPGESPE